MYARFLTKQVRLCVDKETGVLYACKILQKDKIKKANQQEYVKNEKQILLMLDHPNCCKLYFTFADEKRLYFVMELISGGSLFTRLRVHCIVH